MAYKPLAQIVEDDDIFANPSSEAVFELVKVKADDDLGNLSITGTEGQVLTLGASGPFWEDAGTPTYPTQTGNEGKFLQTDGSDVSWQSVTGFEPEVSLTADRVVISNASGKLAVSSVTPTTLGYLDVSSSVTGLFNSKQDTGNYITALSGDVSASGPGSAAATVSSFAGTSLSQDTTTTTNATVTTLQTIATSTDKVVGLESKVAARRTGGASGTAGDSAYYILHAMVKNISGTVTVSTVSATEFENQTSWNADFVASGTNVLLRITGAAGNNISWKVSTQILEL